MEQLNQMPPGQGPGPGGMQRPQPGNMMQQVHAQIMQSLRNSMHQLPQGWQQTYDPRERAGRVMQMVSGLRLLQSDVSKCLNIALSFEIKMISEAPDRATYIAMITKKLNEITAKRHNMAPMNMQNPQMRAMPMNPNMGMMPNGLPNMPNNMQGGLGNNNPMNGLNNVMGGMQGNGQAFPAQLQRQMQPSLPQQPSTLDPSALLQQNAQQPQQRPQMNPQLAQAIAQGQGQGQLGGQQAPTHEDIVRIAQGMYNRAPEDRKMAMRNSILGNMTPEVREQAKAEGMDPLMKVFYARAHDIVMKTRSGGGQNGMGQNMGQPDFTSILGQQANGLKSQESGNEVVPASDNNVNFNAGGQMNVPQGMNPQMLGIQGNQPGGNAAQMNSQMQFMMAQQERQQRLQRNHLIAQQQAHAAQSQHANQLRGQPGGLNAPNALTGGPPGQMNSPAMPTLNRPMGPAGKANPNAAQQAQNAQQPNQNQNQPQPGQQPGQQNRPQGPQGNMNQQPTQVAQQQQMLNQGNSQGNTNVLNPQQHQQLLQFIRTLPMEFQQKLSALPPQQAQAAIARMRSQAQQRGLLNQQQPGAPNNMAMQQNGQQQSMGGMQQNNSNNIAGLGAQPPQGQPNQNFDPQKQLQQQQQQAAIRQRAMDFARFPPQILQQIGVNTAQNITVWGELKRHVQQTQNILPPGTYDRVMQAQHQYFETHPDELPRAMQALRTRLQQAGAQGQQSGAMNALQQMNMQNGGPPQMQNVPPNAGMQLPNGGAPGMGQGMPRLPPNLTITQQEIQAFRERNAQLTQNMTDEHLRSLLTKKKLDTLRQSQQHLFQHNALRTAQQMQQPQPQPQRPLQQPGPPQMGGQGVQQPRPQATGSQSTPAQGQKRPQSSHDDVVEIPNPNVSKPHAAAAVPTGQATQGKQTAPTGLPKGFPTKEQLEKMPPQAREAVMAQIRQQQRDALRKAQSGLPNAAAQEASPYQNISEQELRAKLSQMFKEMVETTKKGPPQQLDPQSLKTVKEILKRIFVPLQRIHETFGHGLRMSASGEARVKAVMKVKVIVALNVASCDEKTGVVIKDYLSINVQQAKELSGVLSAYFAELKARKEGPAGPTQAPQPALAPVASAAAVPAAPNKRASASAKGQGATAAQSASMAKTASQQGHARKASTSKAPPAPTDNKTFDWGAPSPHGVPQYNLKATDLTPDKLKMPPTKRAKKGQNDSQTTTPAAQAGSPVAATTSPKLGKTTSPQQQRKTTQHIKEEAAQKEAESRKFRCKEILCEGSITGFETEAELQKHVDNIHQQPIEDPLAFLLANEPIEVKAPATKDSRANVVANRKTLVKERPLSTVKLERAGTSSPAVSAAAVQSGISVPKPESLAKIPEATLRESMAAKLGFDLPVQAEDDNVAQSMDNDGEDQFMAMLENAAFGAMDGVDDLATFSNIDDYWTLRPEQVQSSPGLTPSDGSTSQSSRSSDISQSERLRINLEWDPWGTGDTCVPAGLQDIESLRLNTEKQADGDTSMVDADDDAIKGADKKLDLSDEQMWDWSADNYASDWDALFGPNAGLEVGEQDWAKELFASYG